MKEKFHFNVFHKNNEMVFSFLGLTDKTFQLTRSIFILQQCPNKEKSTVFEIYFFVFLAELPQLLSFVVEFESKENP